MGDKGRVLSNACHVICRSSNPQHGRVWGGTLRANSQQGRVWGGTLRANSQQGRVWGGTLRANSQQGRVWGCTLRARSWNQDPGLGAQFMVLRVRGLWFEVLSFELWVLGYWL
jgi:hypothetical protein